MGMRAVLAVGLTSTCLAGCLAADDSCDRTPLEAGQTWTLSPAASQARLETVASAKDCHATFSAQVAHLGELRYDGGALRPQVLVSADAVGTGGEQPGLVAIFETWTRHERPETGEYWWTAEASAGAKNIDAPAVIYGMFGVLQSTSSPPVEVTLHIASQPPPAETEAEARAATCR